MRTLVAEGMVNDDVKSLQKELGLEDCDGVFGPKTAAACKTKYGTSWFSKGAATAPKIGTPEAVIAVALNRLKNPLKWENGNWIDLNILGPFRPLIDAKDGHRFSWCAAWSAYCLRMALPNFPLKSHQGRVFTSVSNFKREAERLGCLRDEKAMVEGDLVAFDWTHDEVDDHIGIFYDYAHDKSKIITLEGNASDAEAVKLRSLSSVSFSIDTEKFLKAYV